MKIINTVFLLLAILVTSDAMAQYLVNQGADIRINSGSTIVIAGNFRNTLDGSITNSGNLYVSGNWTNDASSGNLLQGTTGTVFFNGAIAQNIGGTAKTWFSNLNMMNNGILGVETSVSFSLILANKSITLGSYNLVMEGSASISGASSLGYIVAAGNGKLLRQVGAVNTQFPVGTATSYVPAVLNNSGVADS
ncbi:MAG: hypothetical protein FJY07_04180, partial [Bacteroidetes bacterium]|nr:hypothetical protein [Bacteroidota bacterium]